MNKFFKNSIILLIIAFALNACKTDYLDDGGLSKAETEKTVYEYLKTQKYHMFDSLITMIDTLKLKDTINAAGTFFAPTNTSIASSSFIDRDAASKFLLKLAFKDKITLKDATVDHKKYASLSGDTISIFKQKTTLSQYYVQSSEPVFFLYYNDVSVPCQTTGILTQNGNGTVLHVLYNGYHYN